MRTEIRKEIQSVEPLDEQERAQQSEVLSWIDSGAEICRTAKPDIPPQHLIAYFVLVDTDQLLLVDHINAALWLPTGGHVEPDEHPRDTVIREAQEELSIEADFLSHSPLFLSIVETVGRTAGHTDVAIWYALRGDRCRELIFDDSEFHRVRWFKQDEIPLERTDKHLGRFLQKLNQSGCLQT